jgi:hypothetical protein
MNYKENMNIEFSFTRHNKASTIRPETRNSWKQTSITMYFRSDNKHHHENANKPVKKKEKDAEDAASKGKYFDFVFAIYCST